MVLEKGRCEVLHGVGRDHIAMCGVFRDHIAVCSNGRDYRAVCSIGRDYRAVCGVVWCWQRPQILWGGGVAGAANRLDPRLKGRKLGPLGPELDLSLIHI